MSRIKPKYIVWVLVSALVLSISAGIAGASSDRDHLFSTIRTVFEVVETYHKDGADLKTFVDGAIRGGLEALGDPHTNYYEQDEFASFLDSLNGHVSGIGIYLDLQGNYVVISAPIKGSPAYKAGLQTGDRILEVDGISLVGGTVEKAQTHIRGEAGTEVRLKIERPAENRTFEVTITRKVIQIPQVEYELLKDSIGYLALTSFGSSATQDFYEAVTDLKKQGATSLVLDLRQNPGGYVTDAVAIASAWVPEGMPVMYEVGKDGEAVHLSEGRSIDLPTVVLVDGGSASAAEILAGAIQDYGAGTLVGTNTYGKGTVQRIVYMLNGAGMKVTIAEYLTGKRRHVDGVGLIPDDVVDQMRPDSSVTKPLTLTRVLGMNVVGMDVLDLQNRLVFLGYDPDTDGTFRSKTMRALYRFQMDHDLPTVAAVDGSVAKAIDEAVASKMKSREDLQLRRAIELLTTK